MSTYRISRGRKGNIRNSLVSVGLLNSRSVLHSFYIHPYVSQHILFPEMALLVSLPTPKLDNLELPFVWPVAFDSPSMADRTRSLCPPQHNSPSIRACKPFHYLNVVAQWSVILTRII